MKADEILIPEYNLLFIGKGHSYPNKYASQLTQMTFGSSRTEGRSDVLLGNAEEQLDHWTTENTLLVML